MYILYDKAPEEVGRFIITFDALMAKKQDCNTRLRLGKQVRLGATASRRTKAILTIVEVVCEEQRSISMLIAQFQF